MPSEPPKPAPPIASYAATAIIVIPVVILIGMLFLEKLRTNTLNNRCAVQTRVIAQALILYAVNHDNQLPPPDTWQQLLIDTGSVYEDHFNSPDSHDTETNNYIYVHATTRDWSSGRVLLYHRPDLHDGGVHFAFHDGDIRLLKTEDALRLINRLTMPVGVP